MGRLDNQLATVLLAMVLGMTILTVICFMTIYIRPDLPFNPLSPGRATVIAAKYTSQAPTPVIVPTSTPNASYPELWTPTATNTLGPTKTSTSTRTPTPTKTSTSTRTPIPTYTNVPLPPPPPNTPTNTPTPFPYIITSHSSDNNCADIGLEGVINGTNGLPVAGVQIRYGELGVMGSRFTASTDGNGRYGALLLPGTNKLAASRSHKWYAYVMKNGNKASEEFKFETDPIYAVNPSYCKSIDPDTELNEFLKKGCILDPCKSRNAIQIKIINWQQKPN